MASSSPSSTRGHHHGGPLTSTSTSNNISTAIDAASSEPTRRRSRLPPNLKGGTTTTTTMMATEEDGDEWGPLLPITGEEDKMTNGWMGRTSGWLGLAVASGTCAAFNGAFAKLTTTELTTSLAAWIARVLGVEESGKVVELVVRCAFFGLNIIFNGVMWTLFTAALSRGTSTTQVSIINTSTNFMATALLGLVVFSESLPPLWWLGAGMLVVGNVVIGRENEGDDGNNNKKKKKSAEEAVLLGDDDEREGDDVAGEEGRFRDEDFVQLDALDER